MRATIIERETTYQVDEKQLITEGHLLGHLLEGHHHCYLDSTLCQWRYDTNESI